MITTRAPSEEFAVLQETLRGMLGQDLPYEYHVWLADEKPTAEVLSWCFDNGDKFGYEHYDVVSQFDADHIPSSSYLRTALPAFSDGSVGYVAAPSVNSRGADESWATRARLQFEAYFHGPGQASLSPGWMPSCIGSHYLVRTEHLLKSGGIGPELDEDFSTSYLLTTNGHPGLFSINTAAVGEGPATFEDCMKQVFPNVPLCEV
ncbi:hypothetical protein WJX74_009213 [Apatococcus lobatus]|uniref:Glycosyltransferase n=1 Tax=Apatococcus lobatus TaxID=904363 RepID=A0AAW1SH58_9CHLO